MRKKSNKRLLSRLLVLLMVVALVGTDASVVAAASITPPDGTYVISNTEQKIAPGITESEVITNDSSGNKQNIDYFCEVDLSGTSTTKIISGYGDYDATKWSMQRLGDQAKAAEEATGLNVVAGINADFYNMSTGEPAGALVMEGKTYHAANGRPYFAILKDGTAAIRQGNVPLADVESAVGGDAIIVKDGKVNVDSNNTYQTIVYSRCAIGIKEDGTVVTFTTHGRNYPISCGRTYKEIAEMMIGVGCKTVLNLDGGGSATYSSQYEGSSDFLVRNNPSDGVERDVSSTLLIVSTAKPTGEFDHASLSPNNLVYTPNSEVQFEATGVDSAGGKAPLPSDATWELEDSKYGTIDENGLLTSNDVTGDVKVNLKSEGQVVGSTTITIAAPDEIKFSNDEVSLGFEEQSNLGLTVKYKGREVIYKDGDFIWTLEPDQPEIPEKDPNSESTEEVDPEPNKPEDMGYFTGNIFTSSSEKTINGYATVTSKYDSSVTAKVYLIIGRLPSVQMDFEDKEVDGQTVDAEDYYSITHKNNVDPNSFLLLGGYNRGGQQGAEIVDLDSGEPVRFGSHALRLDYDFTGDITNTEGCCIGYNNNGAAKEIEGNPTGIGMWVYAPEGTANLWLRIYVLDGNNSLCPLNFTEEARISEDKMGGIDWTGWKYVEAELKDLKTGNPLSGPFKLVEGQTVRLMYVPGTKMGFYKMGADGQMELVPQAQRKGSLYIDNLQFVYGANNDDVDNPVIDSITANDVEITDGMTIDTNTIKFKSLYSDVENKNTSGIDYDTVRIYLDGQNMTSGDNCVNVPGDNAINLYDVKLSNGPHNVKVLVRDKFGNETTETRYFNVQGDQEYNTVQLSPITEGNPVLNKNYELGLKTEKIEDIDAVETEIKINKDFTDYEVTFNDDFEGTTSYDSKNGKIILKATRKEGVSTQIGEGNIATINFKVSKELKKGSVFTYCAEKGLITYNTDQEEGYTKTFASAQESIEVVAPLTIKADQMVVGFDGKIYVNDLEGNPVSEATIYKDGTEIGNTNEEGYLQTDALCQETGTYSLYTTKGEDISYSINVKTTSAAGNEEGLPEYVVSNATTGSATSKNITWMSNPKTSDSKAIMQIAKKSDYDANGEAAFTDVEGTSKLQSFLGSPDATQNRSVRVNKVLATGLAKNTQYAYRVGDGKQWSEVKTFKTNRAGTNTNFFVIGDTQISNKENVDIIAANLAADGNYSFGIQTGDSVDNASIYSHWTDVLQLFGDNYLSGVDMIHVLGNHEYMGDLDADAAQNIYNLPNSRRYSVEYGNVYVATISYTVDKNQLKEDLEWLKQDAKASKCKWKVLTMHQPAYYTNSAGSNEMINELVPAVVDEIGIDFVFAGHDHTYARTKPIKDGKVEDDGTVYYICGSTGEKSYGISNNPDFHFDIATQDFNGIYITASTTEDEMTVITHDVDGSVIDSYTKTKSSEECLKDGHDYVYDGEYLTCNKCGNAKELGNYTGFVTEEITGKKMYFINGAFQTGWVAYGANQMYHFGLDGLAHDVVVTEDVPTTCTVRGYKIYKCKDCNLTYKVKYVSAAGHEYVKQDNGKYICSICDHEGKYIGDYNIKLGYKTTTYSGIKKTPKVTIEGLERSGNYTVHYFDAVDAGTGRVVIRTKGSDLAAGEVELNFTIKPKALTSDNVTLEYTSVEANGNPKTPEVKVVSNLNNSDVTLVKDKDYTVKYTNNVNIGTAKVTVTGIGNFSGTITKTFTIKENSVKVDAVTGFKSTGNTSTEIDLAWDKADCDGYEISRYSTATKTYNKIVDIDNPETTTYQDTGRTPGAYSQYKIRAYKVVDGGRVYSILSDKIKVTTNPLAPEVKVEKVTDNSASLSWNAVNRATGYEVYRADKDSEEYELVKSVTATTFEDKGLEQQTTYKYKVKAFRTVDEINTYSEDSNIVEATTEEESTRLGEAISNTNVRSSATTKLDNKIGYLTKGTKVEIVEKVSASWYKIKYEGGYGYVSTKYVKLSSYEGETTTGVNVRSTATTKADNKIGYLAKGTKLEIVELGSNGWYKVKYEDGYGYISGKNVKLIDVEVKTISGVNVRSGSSSSYSKLGYLTKGTTVKVLQRCSNGWYKIEYKDGIGYISDKYAELY